MLQTMTMFKWDYSKAEIYNVNPKNDMQFGMGKQRLSGIWLL